MKLKSLVILFILTNAPRCVWSAPSAKVDWVEIAQGELIKARQLVKSNRLKEGISVLRRAYRAHPSPEILAFLGKIYDRFPQGCSYALASWKLLVDTCQKTCPFYQEGLSRLKLAELECQGRLIITSVPSQAEVFVGDQLQGVTPFEMPLTASRPFNLMVFKRGYGLTSHQVDLKRGWKKREIKIKLPTPLNSRGATQTSRSSDDPTHPAYAPSKPKPLPDPSASVTSTALQASRRVVPHEDETESPFSDDFNPFPRLTEPTQLKRGKIARSKGRSLVSELRCQYLTRFNRYVDLDRCDGAHLMMYDRYYLALNLQQDAYVYVIMSNQSGQWQLIFPKPEEDHLIKAHTLTTIPHKEWVLFDQMKDTTDVISVLASPHPIPTLEQQRAHPDLKHIPMSLMRHFVPMSDAYQGKVKSAQVMNRETRGVTKSDLVLHTSYRIHR